MKMIVYQVLDSVKVVSNGRVALWTELPVDLQASHQVILKVRVNLHKQDRARHFIWNIMSRGFSPFPGPSSFWRIVLFAQL